VHVSLGMYKESRVAYHQPGLLRSGMPHDTMGSRPFRSATAPASSTSFSSSNLLLPSYTRHNVAENLGGVCGLLTEKSGHNIVANSDHSCKLEKDGLTVACWLPCSTADAAPWLQPMPPLPTLPCCLPHSLRPTCHVHGSTSSTHQPRALAMPCLMRLTSRHSCMRTAPRSLLAPALLSNLMAGTQVRTRPGCLLHCMVAPCSGNLAMRH